MPLRRSGLARDIHAEITNRLVAAIESNPGEFQLPWRGSGTPNHIPINALTKKTYGGVNVLSLWVSACDAGFASPAWATYRQWAECGCQVRKGEKSSPIVFYKTYAVTADAPDDEEVAERRVARASHVFNAAQVEGSVEVKVGEPPAAVERLATADRFIAATGAKVRHGGDRAYYSPTTDRIQMPDLALFTGTATLTRSEGYYATLVHELVHWSGAKSRLDRDLGKRFGSQAYAAEELVAEIGAAFLCAELSITQDTRPDHAQYLAGWVSIMKRDTRAVFTAAAKASEAVAFLRGPHTPVAPQLSA